MDNNLGKEYNCFATKFTTSEKEHIRKALKKTMSLVNDLYATDIQLLNTKN